MTVCCCGCAKEIPWKPHHKYHPPKYYPEHQRPFLRRGKFKQDATSHRTHRYRARQVIVNRDACELAFTEECKGARIEVHHKDANPTNNDPSNLAALCPSHHKMIEMGRITFDSPRMPEFYVDRSGKRRYAQKP